MTYKLRLDREFYSRSEEIYQWIRSYVGPSRNVDRKGTWDYYQQFGYTFLEFDNYKDYTMFKETFKC